MVAAATSRVSAVAKNHGKRMLGAMLNAPSRAFSHGYRNTVENNFGGRKKYQFIVSKGQHVAG